MAHSIPHKYGSMPLSDGKYYLYLFLIWPFLAFISALFNYSQKEARNTVYFFLIYYGLTFVLGQGYSDSVRYAFRLQQNAELDFSEIFNILGGLYSSKSSVDIFESFISFLVSRFTTSHNILFAVYAAIFGFFYLKSIFLLYQSAGNKSGIDHYVYLAFFVFILPITAINGFRMWTASWIFFFGAYHVVLYRNPKYFLLTLFSVLVHWSFLSANAILLIYFFAGNRKIIYYVIVVASFVLPELLLPLFDKFSFVLGGGLQHRYELYTNENYVLARQLSSYGGAWFIRLKEQLLFYYILCAIVLVRFAMLKTELNKNDENLYCFLLLFLAFVNFGKEIPSFGGRFQILFYLFSIVFLYRYSLKRSSLKLNYITYIGLIPMLLFAVVEFRQGAASINAMSLLPGFGIPLLTNDYSLAGILF